MSWFEEYFVIPARKAVVELEAKRAELDPPALKMLDNIQSALKNWDDAQVACSTCGKPVPDRDAEAQWCSHECYMAGAHANAPSSNPPPDQL